MNAVIEKWEEILQTVKSEYEVTDVPFNTWLKPLEVYEVDGMRGSLRAGKRSPQKNRKKHFL